MTAGQTTAARLRGTAAGLLTAALAVAAHGAADGAAPSGTAVALLAVLAATVAGLATTMSKAADLRVLLGLLAAAQAVGHVMLTAVGHSHGTFAAPATAMLVAHAFAVVSGAVLIAAGDRLCQTVARVIQVAVRAVAPPVPAKPFVIADADHPLRSALLLAASVSHRGPPVSPAR
jgi:hypothetical protein